MGKGPHRPNGGYLVHQDGISGGETATRAKHRLERERGVVGSRREPGVAPASDHVDLWDGEGQ